MAVTLVSGQTLVDVGDHWPSGTASSAKTLPVAATAGNLIVIGVRVGDGAGTGSVSSIDDAGTTVYARARAQQNTTTGTYIEWWWGIAAGTNPGTGIVVTISGTAPSSDNFIVAMEFAGNDGTQASLSVNGANTSATTSHDSGSVTPGTADNVIVAMSSGSSREWTNDADFTNLLDNNRSLVAYKIQSSDTAQSYTATSDINADAAMAIVAFKGATGGGDPAPTITDVDSDESITSTQVGWDITGTDFDTATVEIRQGSETVSQTVNSQNGTTINCDTVFDDGAGPHLKYGSATLAVINGDAQEDTVAIALAVPTGRAFVDIDTPNTTADNRITAVSDIASGDQLEISNVIGGTISDVTVYDDGTFDAAEAVDSFDVRVWDASDATWGNIATQTVGDPPADETPDAFSFTDVTGAQTSTVQTSNTITVSGLGDGVSVDVTITGGTYSKNSGAFTASAGTAINGDTFVVRHTSSSSYETAVDTPLTIGGVSDTFTSTTQAEPAPSEGGGLVLPILRRRRR